MVIAVIGLGLIGGSLCKAIKQYTSHTVFGIDRDESTCKKALSCGAVDKIIAADGLKDADLSIVCLYPSATVDFIRQNIGNFKEGGIITDVCGVKEFVCNETENAAVTAASNLRFVGGHPMAGKEHSGFDASDSKLFMGASYILVKTENTDTAAFDCMSKLIADIGAKLIITSPEIHDKIIAYTSQLAHVVSSSYVKSPSIELERGFTGGSFQDMTRVALLSEEMWADLFLLNAKNLAGEIGSIIASLNEYKNSIEKGDRERLTSLLREGKEIKKRHLK